MSILHAATEPAAPALDAAAQARLLHILAATEAGTANVSAAEQQAFDQLYHFYAPRLKSFLLKQGAGERADDLVQDSLIKVWQQAARFDASKASASTWIYTIARNTWVDAVRREDYPDMDTLMLQAELAATPEGELSRQETVRAVQAALAELPAAQQQVLARAFFDNQSHADIAAATGQPLGTVKSRLRLAFEHMRTILKKERGQE